MKTQTAVLTTAATLALIGIIVTTARVPAHSETSVKQPGAVTYTKSIAPILYQNCELLPSGGPDRAVCPDQLCRCPKAGENDRRRHPKPLHAALEGRAGLRPLHGRTPPVRRPDQDDPAVGRPGRSRGRSADLPPMPKYPQGWALGQPDAVLQPGEAYTLAADGGDVYRCFVIPTSYTEDRWLSGMEVHPGNRKVVHHIIAYLDTTGAARKLDAADPGPGYTSFGGPGFTPTGALGGWVPGNDPALLPDGVGIFLPKGADIVLQVHYHKDGKPETDLTQIGPVLQQSARGQAGADTADHRPVLYHPGGRRALCGDRPPRRIPDGHHGARHHAAHAPAWP